METSQPYNPNRVTRAARAVADLFRIHAWSELPASLDAPKPIAAIIEYPHDLELCEPPELGWQHKGVGIPERTDGTRPRAV